MTPQLLTRIQWMTIGVGLVLTLVFAWWKGGIMAASVAIGCGVALVNFEILKAVVRRMIQGAANDNAASVGKSAVLFIVKMIVLAGVLYALMRTPRLEVVGIAVGFVSFFVALVMAPLIPVGTAKPASTPGSKVD